MKEWFWPAALYALLTSFHIPLIGNLAERMVAGLGEPTGRVDRFERQRRMVFVNSSAALCIIVPLWFIPWTLGHQHFHVQPMFWVYIPLAGVNQCVGLGTALLAYKTGELTVVAPLAALGPAIVALLSPVILSHEHYTLWSEVGVGITLLAASLLEYQPGSGFTTSLRRLGKQPGAIAYIIARLLWAPFPFLLKAGLDSIKPVPTYFVSVILIGTMVLVTLPFTKNSRSIVKVQLRQGSFDYGRPLNRYECVFNRSVKTLFKMSGSIITIQQYAEITAYNWGNTPALLAIFKLSIPFVFLWSYILPKPRDMDNNAESHAPPSKQRVAWRAGLTVVMTLGAMMAGS